MTARQQILSVILSVCITVSSILCGFQEKPAVHAAASGHSKVFKFEGPGLAILNFTGKSLSQSIFFPDDLYDRDIYKFGLYKKIQLLREYFLINPFLRNVFYVFVSINAP